MAERYKKIGTSLDRTFRENYDYNVELLEQDANESKNIAESAELAAQSVQQQFNQVVIDGDSSVEAAQARVSDTSNGTIVYDTLKDRLDNSDNEIDVLSKRNPEVSLSEFDSYKVATADGYDWSPAVKQAIQSVVDSSQVHGETKIKISNGQYKIYDSGVLTSITENSQGSITFEGENWRSTELILVATTSTKWFYDNGVNPKFMYSIFSNIKFTGEGNFANFMKMTSSGHDQGFRFFNCWFDSFQTVFHTEGTGNADKFKFFGCRFIRIKERLFYLNNNQSVAHEFFGCDVHLYGDGIVVGPEGGGSLHFFGGSIVMYSEEGNTTYHNLVYITPSANVSRFNGDITFHAVKTELHSSYSRLVDMPNVGGGGRVKFDHANLSTNTGVERELVFCGLNKQVTFDHCEIPEDALYRVGDTEAARANSRSNQGEIKFFNCTIPENLPSKVTFDGGVGLVSARGCVSTNAVPTSRNVIDFDLNWENGGLGTSFPSKTTLIKAGVAPFPYSVATERKCILPEKSTIKSIKVKKNAQGTSQVSYQLFVGNDDKTVIYGQSTLAQFKDEHKIMLNDLFTNVGTSLNSRTIRIWAASGGNIAQTGGVAVVEYY